jgi:hypothetical protein
MNPITHYLDQFVQLLEGTRLDYTKYHAASKLHKIFLLIDFMMCGMNCLALLLITSLSLYSKSYCAVSIFALSLHYFRLIPLELYFYSCVVYKTIIHALLLNMLLRQYS